MHYKNIKDRTNIKDKIIYSNINNYYCKSCYMKTIYLKNLQIVRLIWI